ncbi:MAG: hypothetical protein O3C21_15625 [Verrucomicrobia bacterium]|nr:hypothetical protein [Verrucomicrobiota bacterium]
MYLALWRSDGEGERRVEGDEEVVAARGEEDGPPGGGEGCRDSENGRSNSGEGGGKAAGFQFHARQPEPSPRETSSLELCGFLRNRARQGAAQIGELTVELGFVQKNPDSSVCEGPHRAGGQNPSPDTRVMMAE